MILGNSAFLIGKVSIEVPIGDSAQSEKALLMRKAVVVKPQKTTATQNNLKMGVFIVDM